MRVPTYDVLFIEKIKLPPLGICISDVSLTPIFTTIFSIFEFSIHRTRDLCKLSVFGYLNIRVGTHGT